MDLTPYQRDICRLLADDRIRSDESYVAGGGALNELLAMPRRSRDLDLFHDTQQALEGSWRADRERSSFIEAQVRRDAESVLIQWARESAYRFFPLVRHDQLGLVLHPCDLATGIVLALVGRVEPRDFVDTLACDREIQPLGYLAWAACGKDPGFSPLSILEHAARSVRYSQAELSGLDFEGRAPDAGDPSRRWHAALASAQEIVALLPAAEAGRAVLTHDGQPFVGPAVTLRDALGAAAICFHEGRIGGAIPRIVPG